MSNLLRYKYTALLVLTVGILLGCLFWLDRSAAFGACAFGVIIYLALNGLMWLTLRIEKEWRKDHE
jgi:hypothetical protein